MSDEKQLENAFAEAEDVISQVGAVFASTADAETVRAIVAATADAGAAAQSNGVAAKELVSELRAGADALAAERTAIVGDNVAVGAEAAAVSARARVCLRPE